MKLCEILLLKNIFSICIILLLYLCNNKIMEDLFWNSTSKPIELNIYADESKSRRDSNWDERHYICIIIDNLTNEPLLTSIENVRFNNNRSNNNFYEKNNKIIHRCDISSADEKNICKRWFQYILDNKIWNFYCAVLWINVSLLSNESFWCKSFNVIYNRFFRTVIIYAIKKYFHWYNVVIKNIFHEKWEQEDYDIFSTHSIKKINTLCENINVECDEIIFLWKDHRNNRHANLLQLCDAYLWAVINILDWCEDYKSKRFLNNKKELIDMMLPLIERLITKPKNKNSSFNYYKHQSISFFPEKWDNLWWELNKELVEKYISKFYTIRSLKYKEDMSPYKQLSLF